MNAPRVCVVVPVFNHAATLGALIDRLRRYHLDCLLVDDGSARVCRDRIDALAAAEPWVNAIHRPANGGKGAAVKDGLRWAHANAYTHALQIDADGQHDADDIATFLCRAARAPHALLYGVPEFDAAMPIVRRLARHLTHFWVHVNTLSRTIVDSMCGFRLYPLDGIIAVLDRYTTGDRMDFDIEVMVKAYWHGLTFVPIPTHVRYPQHGVSHFRMLHDNALIAMMHTRCFFGMLRRAPLLLARRRHSHD